MWLSVYCLPVTGEDDIRPETFVMAYEMAEGKKHAVGVAVLAHLYNCLDQIVAFVTQGGVPNDCTSVLPAHWIMGWFGCHGSGLIDGKTLSKPGVPSIVEIASCNCSSSVNFIIAHQLFTIGDEVKGSLDNLAWRGPLVSFPSKNSVYYDDIGKGEHAVRLDEETLTWLFEQYNGGRSCI